MKIVKPKLCKECGAEGCFIEGQKGWLCDVCGFVIPVDDVVTTLEDVGDIDWATHYLKQNTVFDADKINKNWEWMKATIKQQKETIEKYENFISACRYAGKDGLPRLRKEATELFAKDD